MKNMFLFIALIITGEITAVHLQPSDMAQAARQISHPEVSRESILISPAFQALMVSLFVDPSDNLARYLKHAAWYSVKQKTEGEFLGSHVVYPVMDFVIGQALLKSPEFNSMINALGQPFSYKYKKFAADNTRLIVGAAATRFIIRMIENKRIGTRDCSQFAQTALKQVIFNALDEYIITPTVKDMVTTTDYNARNVATFIANLAAALVWHYFAQ